MKKFMKGCAVTAFVFAIVGFVLGLVGGTRAGRSTIFQIVDSVTGGKAHIFHRNWWGWGIEFDNDLIDTGQWEHDMGEDYYDESMFDQEHEILKGDVDKYCPGSGIRNLDIEAGGCRLITELSQDDSIYLEVSNGYVFQGFVEDDTLYIKSSRSTLSWAEKDNCTITLYLPADYHFLEVEAEIGAGYMQLDRLAAEDVSLEAGAGQIELDSPQIQNVEITVGAGSVSLCNMNAAYLDVEVGMGELYAEGILNGDADVECSMGSVTMELNGRESDYNYEVEGSMGNIDIQGESYIGLGQERSINNHADKTISVECSMGYVSVVFVE